MKPEGEFRIPLRVAPGNAHCFRWRFVPMAVARAAMNMAVDEALLLGYLDRLSPQTIRLYGWSLPSVTYGYRVDPSEVDAAGYGDGDVVRRQTGGGVVYHGDCVTIAIVGGVSSLGEWAGREGLPPRSINRSVVLYRAVNAVVKSALRDLGVESSLIPSSASWISGLYCFSSPCAYDIVAGGRKIYGAAQLRSGGSFLYQGNLLLEDGFDVDGFYGLFREGLRTTLGWEVLEGELSTEEREEAEKLRRDKYGSADWNRLGRRHPGRRVARARG